jgi:CelD/BcsL family acetyltransferase involved in cellulose biosynthesis
MSYCTAVRYSIEWVDDPERFAALGEDWDGLLGEGSMPFDRHCWYSAWWKAFGEGRRLRVCVVSRDGRLQAVFPLVFNGRRLEAMANVHTPVFRPIAGEADALKAVAIAALESGFESLELAALPAGDEGTELLRHEARAAGLTTLVEAQHVSPIVDTTGSFEDWREGSKPRWRAPLERFRRKMARDHDAAFSIVEPPSDLKAQLRAGFAVEASGWKGQVGTAITSSPETETFYRELARSFHDRDELRLSEISLDGVLVAFDLCLLFGNRLYLLKTGFDEGFRKLAPGLVMRLSIIERCFELGLDGHELLGDDSEWKRKFSTGERAHQVLRAYRRRPVALARYGYRVWLRPFLKRVYRGTAGRSRPAGLTDLVIRPATPLDAPGCRPSPQGVSCLPASWSGGRQPPDRPTPSAAMQEERSESLAGLPPPTASGIAFGRLHPGTA